METQKITLDLPSDILLSLNENENELKKDIKIALAIHLYQYKKLTIGKAAQLSGLSRFDFETLLSEKLIPISNLSLEDVLNDAGKLQ